MAKDMYQKRKERQEIKNNKQESFPKVGINWVITTYGKLPRKAYK